MNQTPFHKASVSKNQNNWNERFTADVIRHKLGEEEGGIGKWEYSSPNYPEDPVRGSEFWVKFLETHPQYYLMEAEIRLAQIAAPIIPNYVPDSAILAMLGIGNTYALKRKDLIVTSQLQNIESIKAVDISAPYISEGLPVIEKARPGVRVYKEIKDIFNDFAIRDNASQDTQVVATMFGGTLYNVLAERDYDGELILPETAVRQRLIAIRRSLKKGDLLIITHDANNDPEKVETAYRGQTEFASNLAHRIKRDTPYKNIDTENVEFRVEFNKKSSSLYHYLTLDFGEGLGPQEIMINNSPKIDRNVHSEWCAEGKFCTAETIEYDGVELEILIAD